MVRQKRPVIPKRLRRCGAVVCCRRPLPPRLRCGHPRPLAAAHASRCVNGLNSLAHVQNPNSQYNVPAIGKNIASKANREGVADRFPDPAVQQSIAGDLADDRILVTSCFLTRNCSIVKTAQHPDANTLSWLQTVPGIGKIFRLVLLSNPPIDRFPRVQALVSSCRLVKWAREFAGTRSWTSGEKIGHASFHMGLFGSGGPGAERASQGQPDLARWRKNLTKARP